MQITAEHIRRAYLAGFNASAEGHNGEYPYADKSTCPTDNKDWRAKRNDEVKKVLAWEPPYCECHGVYEDCGYIGLCR